MWIGQRRLFWAGCRFLAGTAHPAWGACRLAPSDGPGPHRLRRPRVCAGGGWWCHAGRCRRLLSRIRYPRWTARARKGYRRVIGWPVIRRNLRWAALSAVVLAVAACSNSPGSPAHPATPHATPAPVTERLASNRFTVTLGAQALQKATADGTSLPQVIAHALAHINALLPGPRRPSPCPMPAAAPGSSPRPAPTVLPARKTEASSSRSGRRRRPASARSCSSGCRVRSLMRSTTASGSLPARASGIPCSRRSSPRASPPRSTSGIPGDTEPVGPGHHTQSGMCAVEGGPAAARAT